MPEYFLGVDGGQSSTTALIGDETGRVLGMGRGGPCNHVSAAEARTKFMGAIGGCVNRARDAAGLPHDSAFAAACLGFSGGPVDKDALIAEMFQIGKRLVTNDAVIALAGAHAGQPGIITIGGTGSISYGRNSAGKFARVGGWGYVYGDEGGGFDITRQGLRAALRMEEGWGPETVLRALLLEATGAANANELMHKFYTPEFPRPKIAAMSQIVVRAASQGDEVATDILGEAAQQLAGITRAARLQLFTPEEVVPVAPIGGVFKSDTLLEEFRNRIELTNNMRLVTPAFGPAAGALLEAYQHAGLSVTLDGVPSEK
ncbi:BadF/BadG/BcrA/BcrD ATPase family protein [uncultured Paludibaculum sp.]|uniref:N-acetylglucosamine kinase n=1 Tax=uncultured Paludibaculum sp. TaxID=1765020 RepID=UPI002AAA86B6|nr:BadF/BadG/BcrA/BcrD ATPase family protein [uncultured Paludibaculum sp.]